MKINPGMFRLKWLKYFFIVLLINFFILGLSHSLMACMCSSGGSGDCVECSCTGSVREYVYDDNTSCSTRYGSFNINGYDGHDLCCPSGQREQVTKSAGYACFDNWCCSGTGFCGWGACYPVDPYDPGCSCDPLWCGSEIRWYQDFKECVIDYTRECVSVPPPPPPQGCTLQCDPPEWSASDGDTIVSQASTFNENLNFNLDITVFLKGGYDSAFSSQTGFTLINGSMIISNGTVVVEGVVLK